MKSYSSIFIPVASSSDQSLRDSRFYSMAITSCSIRVPCSEMAFDQNPILDLFDAKNVVFDFGIVWAS